jgi:hypothetical protein
MTQTRIPQSIFPDLPREIPAVDKQGNFTALWSLGLSALFQALQQNFKNEGIVFPPLTATQMATIAAIYTPLIGQALPSNIPDISGQTIFNSTLRNSWQFVIVYNGATPPIILSAGWVLL